MSLVLLDPGLQSRLVDAGRPRSRSLGIPAGGASDRAALALGNALVGNPPNAPTIEFTLSGPTVEARHRTAGVVFGAPFVVTINRTPVAAGMTFTLEPGDVLRVGTTTWGVRGYLCVAGGFDGPEVLGSRSGFDPLKAGAELVCPASWCEPRGLPFVTLPRKPNPPAPFPRKEGGDRADRPFFLPSPLEGEGLGVRGTGLNDSGTWPSGEGAFPSPPTPLPSAERGTRNAERKAEPTSSVPRSAFRVPRSEVPRFALRVLDGPQRDWFTDDRFFAEDYEVTPASDRMGVRFSGRPLARRPGELVSEAVAPGAVQITNDGQPVVLGVDGQTIGGYPKVAHVIRADLDVLAQLRPGERVRFVRVTADEADSAAKERAATLRGWLARLRAAERQPIRG